jgi:hypothetical protein
MFSNDNGNTGAGGARTDFDSLFITIADSSPENAPPVNVLPPPVTFGQLPAVLSRDNFNTISVTDIDAGFSNNFLVSLSVADGRLALPDRRNLTVTGNGTSGSPLLLTGTLADINERLAAGLQFIPSPLGSTILTIVSNDRGNTGTGGAKTDTDTLVLNLIDDNPPVNDPPVNYVPPNFTTSLLPVVLSELNLNQLSVADIDAGNATNFMVTLSVPTGELSLSSTSGLSVAGNGTNILMLTGSIVDINRALVTGLQFLPPAPFLGQTVLTIESNDKGNTGTGGPKTATNSVTITIADSDPVNNDAPINHLPPPVVSNQLPTVLSRANGNQLFVTDIDAGNANNFTVSLSVPLGRLSIVNNPGITRNGNGTPTSPLVLTGTLANINVALAAGLSFLPPSGFIGSTKLTIVSNDMGNTGAGGAKTDTDQLDIEIADLNPANDPPVNHLPPPITAVQLPIVLSATNLNELFVTDIDAGAAPNFVVTLTVADGLLALTNSTGLVMSGNGSSSSPMTLTGSLANINAALSTGLEYNPTGFLGTTTLTMLSNDNGNSGPGGPLTDSDRLSITVVDNDLANNPPLNHLPPPITTANSTFSLSTANGNSLSVTDNDAGNANNFMVTLALADGTLSLSNSAGLVHSGNGSLANPLILTGRLLDINLALSSGLFVQLPNGFVGTTSLNMISNDQGNAGIGGPLVDTDALSITVVQNVAPRVVSVIADSSSWTTAFRDYVDGTFTDPSALGYRLPKGPQQFRTIPWVNVDRLKVVFSEDVGGSLSLDDFKLTTTPGFVALSVPPGTTPTLAGLSYDSTTFTATLALSKAFPAAVVDLRISAEGVSDINANRLDGEWLNAVALENSGDGAAGGDFSFRLYVLPGDVADLSAQRTTWNVNATDGQLVRDLQNGLALPGIGVFGYDPRADLDGNNRINSNDGTLIRDQQNAVIARAAAAPGSASSGTSASLSFAPRQNFVNPLDVNADNLISPLDALLTINVLNATDPREVLKNTRDFLDVSGDGLVTPLDVLLVINWLNSPNASSSTEASSIGSQPEGELRLDELLDSSFDDNLEAAIDLLAFEITRRKRLGGSHPLSDILLT